MKRENISKVIGNINEKHISEAENYTSTAKRYSIKTFFIKAPVAACLILCLLVGTVAYAAYEAYEWSTSILFEDGSKVQLVENATFKEIPDSAPKTERTEDSIGTIKMTHAEVEKVLGFNILGYDKATSDEMGYKTMQNKDGTIGRIDLWWADFLEINEEKQITLHISMLNKGADEGFILAFEEGQDAAGGKKLENVVTIDSLDTKIVVYKSDSHDNKITMTFVYDNVLYQFGGYDFTESEMLSVIEQMK